MPLYDFECTNCKKKVTMERKITCNDDVICDVCNLKMEIRLQSNLFVLKGSRWAKDGYSGGTKC